MADGTRAWMRATQSQARTKSDSSLRWNDEKGKEKRKKAKAKTKAQKMLTVITTVLRYA
jgi:hypothetical protein